MTRTQQLTTMIESIYQDHKGAIDALPTQGPNGGSNAASLTGWVNYSNGTITKAANNSHMPVLSYWSGSLPTPSSALPEMVEAEVKAAYSKIFEA